MAATQHTLDELYELLGQAIGDVMEHERCPQEIYNRLGELCADFVNLPRGSRVGASQARNHVPSCLSLYSEEVNGADEPDGKPDDDTDDESEAA